MTVDRPTLSILQACQRVGVSRRTIYNWMAAGKVEYVRTAGGAVRIFSDTLWRAPGNEVVRSRGMQPTLPPTPAQAR
jgi:excisionase family DNA binding protein